MVQGPSSAHHNGQLSFDKDTRTIQWGKEQSFQQMGCLAGSIGRTCNF